jgi:hypothetical protein
LIPRLRLIFAICRQRAHAEPTWIGSYKRARSAEIAFGEMTQDFKGHWLPKINLNDKYKDSFVARVHGTFESAQKARKQSANDLLAELGIKTKI